MRTAAYDGGETVKERRGAELAPGTTVSDPALYQFVWPAAQHAREAILAFLAFLAFAP
jgi:hypothetical protein